MKSTFFLPFIFLISISLIGCGGFISHIQKRKAVKSGYVTQKGFTKEIPFEEYTKGKYIILAKLNNSTKTYRFIVDTGTLFALSAEAADELGLIKKEKHPNINQSHLHLKLDSVDIEGLHFYKVGVAILDLNADPYLSKCAKIDGLIGTAILKHFVWQFDTKNKKILVSDTYNTQPTSSDAIRLPFSTDHYNRALVKCTFPNGKSKKFIFDTGGSGFITNDKAIFFDLKDRAPYLTTYGLSSYGWDGPQYDTSYTAKISNFKVAHLSLDTAEVLFSNYWDNHVGWGFLQNYKVTFDWGKKEILLVPYEQRTPVSNPLSFGFTPFVHLDKKSNQQWLVVASIIKDSPAYHAGMKLGDRIVQIAAADYEVVKNYCEVFEGISLGPDENETTLTILRDGKRMTVNLRRDRLYKK